LRAQDADRSELPDKQAGRRSRAHPYCDRMRGQRWKKRTMIVKNQNAETFCFRGRYGRRFQALTAGKRQNYAAMYGLISDRG
jgi:hypothetical protein